MTSRQIDAGKAAFTLELQDRLTTAIKKTLDGIESRIKRVQNVGQSLGNVGRNIAAVGTAISGFGIAATAGLSKATFAAGDFAETLSKFETVFSGQAENVRQWAQTFGEEVGRSEGQLLKFLGNAQDTFIPLGFNPQEAAEFSKTLTKLAVDLASFNNLSDDQAFNRLLSAVVGNTENLKAFGVVAQDAQIKQEALLQGFDPKQLTPYEKALSIVSLTIKGTAAAQDDASRTAGSFNNRIKALQASFAGLSVAIGSPLLEPATRIAEAITGIVKQVRDFAKNNEDVVKSVGRIALVVTSVGATITALGIAFVGVGAVVSTFAGAVLTVGSALAGLVTIGGTIAAAIATPFGLVVASAGAAFATVVKFSGALDGVVAGFKGVGQILPRSIDRIKQAFEDGGIEQAARQTTRELRRVWSIVAKSAELAWSSAMDFVKSAAEDAAARVAGVFTALTRQLFALFASLPKAFGEALALIGRQADGLQSGLLSGIIDAAAPEDGKGASGVLRGIARSLVSELVGVEQRVQGSYEDTLGAIGEAAGEALKDQVSALSSAAEEFNKSLLSTTASSQQERAAALEKLKRELEQLATSRVEVELNAGRVFKDLTSLFNKIATPFENIFAPAEAAAAAIAGAAGATAAAGVAQSNAVSNSVVAREVASFAPTADPDTALKETTERGLDAVESSVDSVRDAVALSAKAITAALVPQIPVGAGIDLAGVATDAVNSLKSVDFGSLASLITGQEMEDARGNDIVSRLDKLIRKGLVLGS